LLSDLKSSIKKNHTPNARVITKGVFICSAWKPKPRQFALLILSEALRGRISNRFLQDLRLLAG
jgi:hypothetical protein